MILKFHQVVLYHIQIWLYNLKGNNMEEKNNILKFNLMPDIPNINGITFTKEAVYSAINTYVEKYVNTDRSFGMIGYNKDNIAEIDVNKYAFKVIDVKRDGNNIYGEIEILDTPEGERLLKILLPTDKIGLSMSGELNNNIVDDFLIQYPVIMDKNNNPKE